MKNKIIITAMLFCSFFVNKTWGQTTVTINGPTNVISGDDATYSITNSDPYNYHISEILWQIRGGTGAEINGDYTSPSVTVTAGETDCSFYLDISYTSTLLDGNGNPVPSSATGGHASKGINNHILDLLCPEAPVLPGTSRTYAVTDGCTVNSNASYNWWGTFISGTTVGNESPSRTITYTPDYLLTNGDLSSGTIGDVYCDVTETAGEAPKEFPCTSIPFKLNKPGSISGSQNQLTNCDGTPTSITLSVNSLSDGKSFNTGTPITWSVPSTWSITSNTNNGKNITVNTNGHNYGVNITAQVTYPSNPGVNVNSDFTTFPITPVMVTNFSVQPITNYNYSSCILNWTVSNEVCAGVTGYRIMSSTGTILTTVSGGATRSCTVPLQPCSSYSISVVAINNGYIVGTSSNSVSVTTPSGPFVLDYPVPSTGLYTGGIFGNTPTNYTIQIHEIDLNPGFSFSPIPAASLTLIGTNTIVPCSTVTPRSSSVDSSAKVLTAPVIKSTAAPLKQTQSQTQTIPPKTVTSATTSNVVMYPNPTNDKINLSILNFAGSAQIAVYDFSGNQVYSTTSATSQTAIDLSSYSSGIYFVKVTSGKMSETAKVIKN